MRRVMILTAALMAASTMPAQAAYVTATYNGIINTVYDGSTFSIGEKIADIVTFDTSTLQDFTSSVNAGLTKAGAPVTFASILAASLSDDPKASMSIKVGDIHSSTPIPSARRRVILTATASISMTIQVTPRGTTRSRV
jgi:hypothetical protein